MATRFLKLLFLTYSICIPLHAQHYTILVLPCGGATSVISTVLLQNLEQQTGHTTKELFNEIWGASAGSIIAGLLTSPTSKCKNARRIVHFFRQQFHTYCRAYFIRQATGNAIGADTLIKQTTIPLRILTAASHDSAHHYWQPYDFGTNNANNNNQSLASIVAASCTVYPHLYRTPIPFSINGKMVHCIDPGSLTSNQPIVDPTAYFLQQLLPQLTSDDNATIYFIGSAFTPTIDYDAIRNVLEKTLAPNSYAIYDDNGTFGKLPQKHIEIVVIPVTTSCEKLLMRYVHQVDCASRIIIRLLQCIFERVVGKENAIANMLAAGVVPIAELEKEGHKIAKTSHNFAMMVQNLCH